jgi:phage repressor protein C with HTH and peptisase S24 domain
MGDNDGFGKRLKELRERIGLSQTELANKLGKARQTIQNYESGATDIPTSAIYMLVQEYKLRPDWLLDGTGDMFLPDGYDPTLMSQDEKLFNRMRKEKAGEKSSPAGNQITPEANCDLVKIPILNAKASAGYGRENYDIDPIGYFLITSRAFPGIQTNCLRNIQVAGDSMSPTLEDGDWVTMVEGLIAGNGIYLLNNGGELFIKRVNFTLAGDLAVISDNPKYSTEKIRREDTVIVGKCVLRLGKLV